MSFREGKQLSEEGDMRELLGRVIATQESHGKELCLVRRDVKEVARRVEQHRTGWQVFMWLGGIGIAAIAAFKGITWHK